MDVGGTMPTTPDPRRRRVFGHVYETILRGQAENEHSYVGKTELTIHQRVHGPNGHTSPDSVAKDPWKARILPGRAGYRKLEAIRDTGDPAENDRALRRAEAFWIDRLRPEYNLVRPVRPPGDVAHARARREPVRRRARRPVPVRAVVCLVFIVVCVWATAWFVGAMELPWPQAPWIVAPTVGGFLGWQAFWRTHRALRRLFR